MSQREHRDLVGHPSDYGSRTLESEERERAEQGEIQRTADGEPLDDRGSAASAISRDRQKNARSDELQGDTDFEQTNAGGEDLLKE
jgi:hypothetical protein